MRLIPALVALSLLAAGCGSNVATSPSPPDTGTVPPATASAPVTAATPVFTQELYTFRATLRVIPGGTAYCTAIAGGSPPRGVSFRAYTLDVTNADNPGKAASPIDVEVVVGDPATVEPAYGLVWETSMTATGSSGCDSGSSAAREDSTSPARMFAPGESKQYRGSLTVGAPDLTPTTGIFQISPTDRWGIKYRDGKDWHIAWGAPVV